MNETVLPIFVTKSPYIYLKLSSQNNKLYKSGKEYPALLSVFYLRLKVENFAAMLSDRVNLLDNKANMTVTAKLALCFEMKHNSIV